MSSDHEIEIFKLQAEIRSLRSIVSKSEENDNKVSAKYRAANSKYREACQTIGRLRTDLNNAKKQVVRKTNEISNIKNTKTYIIARGIVSTYIFFVSAITYPARKLLGAKISKQIADLSERKVDQALVSKFQKAQNDKRPGDMQKSPTTDLKVKQQDFAPPSPAVQAVSILGWPAPSDNGKPIVMGVMDEFTESCFASDLRLLQPRPDNWYALANKYPPKMVFVESAWKGNGGSWQYRVGRYNVKPGRELEDISIWARQEKIPSVFWNKEDPVHHDKFIETASLMEHIFTTDQNMVESYKKKTGNSSVHALPFAAQPVLHKPSALNNRIAKSCFAGSWYGNRHAERGEAMKWLLQTARKHGLEIFDRNFGTGIFPFPEDYQECIRGSLPYKELCEYYGRYRLFINVNSVTNSPTMFSRRVFELMACGTPVVSTYAKGIETLFDSDAVWLVRTEAEANEAIYTLMNDDEEWRRRSLEGIREIFSGHTYAHRMNYVFEKIGSLERIETEPGILLLAHAKSEAEVTSLLSQMEKQRYRSFELLIECAEKTSIENAPKGTKIVQSGAFQTCLKRKSLENFAGIGWISPNCTYGQHYLRDLANAMIYQPEANGWAKSITEDAFAFGGKTKMTAVVWRSKVFFEKYQRFNDIEISNESLYCVDTNEFDFSTS